MTDSDFGRSRNAILKKDVKGRVRTSVRQREAILDEFERSGLRGPKFSQVAGVCYQTFAGWMLKRQRACGEHDNLSPVKVSVCSHKRLSSPSIRSSLKAGHHGPFPDL